MFDKIELILVPFINIDGFKHISESYGTNLWDVNKLQRKNLNKEKECITDNENPNWESGVDLNRNYDYKFGFDEEGSVNNPCD